MQSIKVSRVPVGHSAGSSRRSMDFTNSSDLTLHTRQLPKKRQRKQAVLHRNLLQYFRNSPKMHISTKILKSNFVIAT